MLARCGHASGPPWGRLRGGLGLPLVPKRRNNRARLGSLDPSGLCRNTFVPLLGTGVDCTSPFPVPSGPPTFGPQGLLFSYPDRPEKAATDWLLLTSRR